VSRASPVSDRDVVAELEAELVLGQLDEQRVDLEHQVEVEPWVLRAGSAAS
jgi:hypothetical protein